MYIYIYIYNTTNRLSPNDRANKMYKQQQTVNQVTARKARTAGSATQF